MSIDGMIPALRELADALEREAPLAKESVQILCAVYRQLQLVPDKDPIVERMIGKVGEFLTRTAATTED